MVNIIRYTVKKKAPLPHNATRATMSYYSVQNRLLFESFLPGHLRKRKTCRDQLVLLPQALISLGMHAYHDRSCSFGRSPCVSTSIREKSAGILSANKDILCNWCYECQACLCRKTPHRGPKLSTENVPVQRPSERISVELVEEYKTLSRSQPQVCNARIMCCP